jgi:hypothetical protein
MSSPTAALSGVNDGPKAPELSKKNATPSEVVTKLLSGLYTLYYRQGNNPHPMQKNFFTNGANLRETVDIAKKHCENMGIRFIRVIPFLSDIRADERAHNGLRDDQE